MVFVPPVPYIPPPQASLEAQELAREIEYAIAEFQESHPGVRQQDIQQAFQLVRSRAGRDVGGRRVMVAVAVGLALLVALLTAYLVMA